MAETSAMRRDIEFDADGQKIRGWLYLPGHLPASKLPAPAVVMAHGFACVKEMYLDRYAEVFCAAGFAVVGASEGTPRHELNPWQQVEDYRYAITFASMQPEIDAERIGIWGTSYSGGHVLVTAATDRRVKCVVAQVPTISGHLSGLRRVPMSAVGDLARAFGADRAARMAGGAPGMRPVFGDPAGNPIYASLETREWFEEAAKLAPGWRNWVTLRTMELSRAYEPGAYIGHISPTPLLMIVGKRDFVTCTDLELEAFNRALEPKKLVFIEGGHFAPYVQEFAASSSAARDWFSEHLL